MPDELEDIEKQFFELFEHLVGEIRHSGLTEIDDGIKYVMARHGSGHWETLPSG